MRTGSLRWTRAEDVRDAAFAHLGGHGVAMAATGRRNADFASVVMELTGATAFVDASKERMRIRHLARHLPMPLRVIHLVRDVRGVAASARHHGAGSIAGVEAAARNWNATNRTILRHVAPAARRGAHHRPLRGSAAATRRPSWRTCSRSSGSTPTRR